MKVEPISNDTLRVYLSQEELEKHTGEREMHIYLRQMLQTAQCRFSRSGKQVFAQLIPMATGWVLLLSARGSVRFERPIVYRIANVGMLYRLAERWVSVLTSTVVCTCLYETDSGYDVAVYPLPKLNRHQTALLKEFGTLIGRGELAAASAAEQGRLLVAGDVFGTLLFTERERRPPTPSD